MGWVAPSVGVLLLVAGCGRLGYDTSVAGTSDGGGDPDPDAVSIDASNVIPGCESWEAAHFDPCELSNPSDDDVLILDQSGSYVYDTTLGQLRDPTSALVPHNHTEVGGLRLVIASRIEIRSMSVLHAVGGQPLILVSTSVLLVEGGVDVSSPRGLEVGAGGGNASSCTITTANLGQADTGGGAGGGGGGFGGAGGSGGNGDFGGGQSIGGQGGVAVATPSTPRGGCAGFRGGDGVGTQSAGAGGPGGGAVELAARDLIQVPGTLHAGGGGGAGPALGTDAGGGGGGSGGYIGLDAPTVEVSGGVFANGGGGGEGSSQIDAGTPGQDSIADDAPASGGANGAENGGDGGDGSDVIIDGRDAQSTATGGGGGGGGGAGFILVFGAFDAANGLFSPPPTQP